jgi:hypothetical protein
MKKFGFQGMLKWGKTSLTRSETPLSQRDVKDEEELGAEFGDEGSYSDAGII